MDLSGSIFGERGWTKGKIKVRDHCHWTGQFRRAAHSSCNLRLTEQTFIPVIFHNLKGYDSHLFIKAFYDLQERPSCIPQNTEKFISFSLKKSVSSELRFLDSCAFMGFPLAKLVGNLKEFPIMSKFFEPDEVEILSRKGVFPYKWFDSFDKLYHTKFLEHEYFFSKLSGKNISKKEYDFGQSVYNRFCKNVIDYHDLYLKTDVLLLADVCQEFGNICHEYFGLDPFNSYTTPGFAWDAALKFSGVELEALNDVDMYLFFEQGIRGRYSNIHKKYSKANHKYLGKYYDLNEECTYLWYVDMNSLYPTVMVEKLPVRDFRWATQKDIDNIFKLCKEVKRSGGSSTLYNEIPPCTLSVNLKHNPKNFDREKVSAMCPDFHEENGVKKLAHTLYDKNDYVVHYRTLMKYLEEGMILQKVNRAVLFTEKTWLKGYIDF